MQPMITVKAALRGLLCLLFVSAVLTAQRQPEEAARVSSYSGPNGHVMVIVPGGEFVMGSPPGERGRAADETQHRVSIPRTFSIATTELTNEQFARFLAAVPDYAARWRAATATRFGDPPRFATFSRTADSPQ